MRENKREELHGNNENCCDAMPQRQTACGVLMQQYQHSVRRHRALDILMKVIPWHLLQKEEDEILWEYFVSRFPA